MSILETNKIQAFDGDNVTLSATNNIQVQADLYVTGAAQLTGNLTGTNAIFTGTVTAEEFIANTVSSSVMYRSGSTKFGDSADDTHTITGGVYHTGQMVHTGVLTQEGNSNVTGSFNISGSINNVGFLRVTGSMETSGIVSFLDYPWPATGSETHILKTAPFIVETHKGNKSYDYLGIALEHIEDSLGENQHNSVSIYAYDSHDTPNYGSVLNVAPLRVDMRMLASGSDSVANVSVRDLLNGETQALLYADNIQIGGFDGQHIVFGNPTSNITSSADIYHISSSLLHIITPDFEVTGSVYFSSTLSIGGVSNVSSSISLNTTTISNVSSSLALSITNLDTATSASDAALDTRVTTAEGHIGNLHAFTGSLNDTYATDAELSAVSGALATSINTSVAGLNAASSSYALASDLTIATGSINVNETNIGLLTALTGSLVSTQTAYNTASGSYITSASIGDYVKKDLLKAIVTGSADFNAFKTAILGL